MKVNKKIISSKTEPNNKEVLWYNPLDKTTRIFRDGWKVFFEGGGSEGSIKDIQYEGESIVKDGIAVIPEISAKDERFTDDMQAYLEKILGYTYKYSGTTKALQTIVLPSDITNILAVVNFSASKSNAEGTTALTVVDVSSDTSGWNKSGKTFVREVAIDKTSKVTTIPSITATITDSDGKTGTITVGAVNVPNNKKWYLFNTNDEELSNAAATVESYISGTATEIYSATTLPSDASIEVSAPYLWFAIPNTLTLKDVYQIAGLSSLESKTAKYTPTTTLGTYNVYRWGTALANGELKFNIER